MTNPLKRLEGLKRNIFLYRLLLIFGGNGLTTSAIYFFFTIIKGLSSVESLFLIGLAALTMAIAEVPTGAIADKFSRKISILIGLSILVISGLLMLITIGFWPLLILVVFQGIGGSFTSGADDALLYDSLKEINQSENFKSIFNLSQSIDYVFFAITVLIGGVLASINLYLPIIGNIILLSISILITLLLTEPISTRQGETIEHTGYVSHIKKSLRTVFSWSGFNNGLLSAFLSYAIISAAFKSTKNILSPVLNEYGITVSVIAIVITVMTLIKAMGGFIASKIHNRIEIKRETILLLLIFITGLLLIAFTNSPIIKLLIFITIISLDTIILTNLSVIINERIESYHRSTILSILSLLGLSSKMIFLTSLGWMIDMYNIKLVLIFSAMWLAIPFFALLAFQYKKLKEFTIINT